MESKILSPKGFTFSTENLCEPKHQTPRAHDFFLLIQFEKYTFDDFIFDVIILKNSEI